MAGIKSQNLVQQQGTSWEDLFGIDVDRLTNATRDNFFVYLLGNDRKSGIAICFYTGSGALTLSEFNNLPVGTVIFDVQSKKWHLHTDATTWVSSAAST